MIAAQLSVSFGLLLKRSCIPWKGVDKTNLYFCCKPQFACLKMMKCIDEVINGYLRNIKYSEIKYDNLRISRPLERTPMGH